VVATPFGLGKLLCTRCAITDRAQFGDDATKVFDLVAKI
jgi:hypothetical protein